MKKEVSTQDQESKKVYQSPALKDLGKIGEVTNTSASGSSGAMDGGASPNAYVS